MHPHRRSVPWTKTGVTRGLFPQKALNEIGSARTLFRVETNVHVFEQFLNSGAETVLQHAPEGHEPESVDD